MKLRSSCIFRLGTGSCLFRLGEGPSRCLLSPPAPVGGCVWMLGLSDLSESFLPNSHDYKVYAAENENSISKCVTENLHLNTVTNSISWAVGICKTENNLCPLFLLAPPSLTWRTLVGRKNYTQHTPHLLSLHPAPCLPLSLLSWQAFYSGCKLAL